MGTSPTDQLGCAVCLVEVYAAGEPRFVAATSPADLLYRCGVCDTWWIGDARSLHPVTDDEARSRFPAHVATHPAPHAPAE